MSIVRSGLNVEKGLASALKLFILLEGSRFYPKLGPIIVRYCCWLRALLSAIGIPFKTWTVQN